MFNLAVFILSLFFSFLPYLSGADLSYWWLPLFFVAYNLLFDILLLTVFYISGEILRRKEFDKPSPFGQWMVHNGIDWALRTLCIRVKTEGTEQLPDTPYVLVSNHLSGFDPLAFLATKYGKNSIVISKPENFTLPIAGGFMKYAGFVSLDRDNALRAMRTLKKASETAVEHRMKLIIYPEGTRSKTGELADFKEGAFLLAKRADYPIVVIRTVGTFNIHKKLFRFPTITLKCLAVIPKETVESTSMTDLALLCHDIVAKDIAKG